jgi:hypothetical protein
VDLLLFTKHVYKDMSIFKTFEAVEDSCILFSKNSFTVVVKGKGTINLEFTSRKVMTLNDVHYVRKIRKNFMSGHLNKFGFKPIFE